ncbi:hypothetical protein UWK_00217 [Desulfocapsa sulfexigens DSM 10523]|uniref:Uncharacterized protein n=1 Tax=Desulfocapsa sulfexigens (strain DSM 10523 / SB164P1) TaxID=1167006 RepID=M1NZU7_DESSD|nr:hypothetical protein [Desulfocapsa sulfexigens]AGF76803.1 hypothetical protein UWK_00217 [Desulfocapsa sulfexigens DSM 10523]
MKELNTILKNWNDLYDFYYNEFLKTEDDEKESELLEKCYQIGEWIDDLKYKINNICANK